MALLAILPPAWPGRGACGRGGHQGRPRLSCCVLPVATGLHPPRAQESKSGPALGQEQSALSPSCVSSYLGALPEGSRFWGPEIKAFSSD